MLKDYSFRWRAEIKYCARQCRRVPLWRGVQPQPTNGRYGSL